MEVWYIILGVPTVLLAFFGNIGTIAAFLTEQSFNIKASDLITMHLAFADLGMSIFTIPIFQVMVGAYGYWPWGEVSCRILLSIAMVLIFAGILFIILMSWDRYLMLSLQYSDYLKKMSQRRVKILIGLTWLAATSQAVYEAAFWDIIIAATPTQYRTDFNKECDCPSMKLLTASYFCTFIFSVIPVFAIAILALLILAKLKERLMKFTRNKYTVSNISSVVDESSEKKIDNTTASSESLDQTETGNVNKGVSLSTDMIKTTIVVGSVCAEKTLSTDTRVDNEESNLDKDKSVESLSKSKATEKLPIPNEKKPTAVSDPRTKTKKRQAMQKRYMKPVITYAVLVLSLTVCTLPLYVYVLYVNINCPECYDYFTAGYFFGILFFNSALNPVLYALTNTKIRAFYCKKYNAIRRWIGFGIS